MFLGHIGVGLAAKKAAPRVSLGWLVAAPMFLDLIWPIFLLLGWESVRIDPGNTRVTPFDFESYPISHSFAASAGWGVFLGAVYWVLSGRRKGAVLLSALVPSHWLLDWVVHRPDLPLYPGGVKFGLGLWNSVPATVAVEAFVFGLGVWTYARTMRAGSERVAPGFWIFVSFLTFAFAANLLGPPPETVQQIAYVTLALWLLPLWAWSFDRGASLRKTSR